jgi:WD40 repeat protein
MDISTSSTSLPCDISSCDVTILEGHTSEVWSYPCDMHLFAIFNLLYCNSLNLFFHCQQVFACAWSPSGSLLASG